MIVVDASLVVEMIIVPAQVKRIRERLVGESAHAPHHLDVEVLNALRGLERGGRLGSDRAEAALGLFSHLRVTRYPIAPLRTRIWELRGSVSAYDAAYVALAQTLRAPLLTADARLARAASDDVAIELFA